MNEYGALGTYYDLLLEEAGFAVRAVYGDRTEEPPGETEQRAVIVAQNLRPAEEYG